MGRNLPPPTPPAPEPGALGRAVARVRAGASAAASSNDELLGSLAAAEALLSGAGWTALPRDSDTAGSLGKLLQHVDRVAYELYAYQDRELGPTSDALAEGVLREALAVARWAPLPESVSTLVQSLDFMLPESDEFAEEARSCAHPEFAAFLASCLEPAFAELQAKGVFASTDLVTCCTSCGFRACERSADDRSFVYYHAQDIDSYSDARGLCLGHSLDPAFEAVTLEVLGRHMAVRWDGDHATKIRVGPPGAQLGG